MMRRVLIPALSIAIVGPLTWMIMDREPPYTRLAGEMIPAHPRQGDFVSVRWTIDVHKLCPPSEPRNVTRRVVDSVGTFTDYAPVEGVFGASGRGVQQQSITRAFQLPSSIEPGPARYHSTACFACNPVQKLFPVCVSTPEIQFTIERHDAK